MIRNHAFHSRWWGAPSGVIDGMEFLGLPRDERERQLRQFAWVELRAPLQAADSRALAAAGFTQIDTQIPFRLGIGGVSGGPSLASLDVTRADEEPFVIVPEDIAPFAHERFRHLPGITGEKITERYALWAAEAIAGAPEWCLRVTCGGATEGWFLSYLAGDGLHLELAMLHRQAHISGVYLYQRALLAYGARGARVGMARFSAENTAVLNIYASLGARFLAPLGIWLWTCDA
jgi:hypothetical protein